MKMNAPFGDYLLCRYGVDCASREIRILASCPWEQRPDTELLFEGVEGYILENDVFGNILGHVFEVPTEIFLKANGRKFAEHWKQAGWPPFWKGTIVDTSNYLEQISAGAWEVTSALGLSGWVVCRRFSTKEVASSSQ